MSQLIDIAVTMALCFAAWGFFYAALYRRWGIDYTRHFLLTTFYFLAVAVILLVSFWKDFVAVAYNFSIVPLIVLGIFMVAQAILCVVFPRYVPEPTAYLEQYPDRYFLKIDVRRLVAKSADIFSQQIFIVLLVVLLQQAGLSLPVLYIAFAALFMLLHVPLIASERGSWVSWLFAGIVIVFSFVFPTCILFIPYGFAYNIIFHWLFYTVTAVTFWLIYNQSDRIHGQ